MMAQLIAEHRSSLQQLSQRLDQASPAAALTSGTEKLTQLAERLERAMERILTEKRSNLAHAAQLLSAVNPAAITDRGYALVRRQDGSLVTDAAALSLGEALEITLTHGRVKVKVEEIMAEEPYDGI